jgi:hypothetical protein
MAAVPFIRLFRLNKNRLDAAGTSLILAALGALALAILSGSLLWAPLKKPMADSNGRKDRTNNLFTISLPIVVLLVTLAGMNVSLVWIRIADNARKMKYGASIDLRAYSRALFLYYAVLLSVVIATAAVRLLTYTLIFSCIGVGIMAVTYVVALIRLRVLIRSFSSVSGSHGAHESALNQKRPMSGKRGVEDTTVTEGLTTKTEDQARPSSWKHTSVKADDSGDSMKHALRTIQALSYRMIIVSMLLIFFFLLYATAGAPNFSPATDAPRSRICLVLAWVQTACLLYFVIAYVYETHMRRARKTAASSAIVAGDKPAHVVALANSSKQGSNLREEPL